VLSYLLYPQVFLEFEKHRAQFGDTSTIPTANFFYGLQPGEEASIEIERGKTLFVKYLTTGQVREDGTRTVFFELNGQPRAVNVADRSVAGTVKRHPKADPENPNHVAAPMPGKVSSVAVRPGQLVRTGERLLSIEAMKMETAVYSPRDAHVSEIHVEAGAVVEARDLLLVLKD
jgi:pyruvate carboxylase